MSDPLQACYSPCLLDCVQPEKFADRTCSSLATPYACHACGLPSLCHMTHGRRSERGLLSETDHTWNGMTTRLQCPCSGRGGRDSGSPSLEAPETREALLQARLSTSPSGARAPGGRWILRPCLLSCQPERLQFPAEASLGLTQKNMTSTRCVAEAHSCQA